MAISCNNKKSIALWPKYVYWLMVILLTLFSPIDSIKEIASFSINTDWSLNSCAIRVSSSSAGLILPCENWGYSQDRIVLLLTSCLHFVGLFIYFLTDNWVFFHWASVNFLVAGSAGSKFNLLFSTSGTKVTCPPLPGSPGPETFTCTPRDITSEPAVCPFTVYSLLLHPHGSIHRKGLGAY